MEPRRAKMVHISQALLERVHLDSNCNNVSEVRIMKNTTVHIQVQDDKVSISYNHSITLRTSLRWCPPQSCPQCSERWQVFPSEGTCQGKIAACIMQRLCLHYFAPDDMRPHLTLRLFLKLKTPSLKDVPNEIQCPDVKTCRIAMMPVWKLRKSITSLVSRKIRRLIMKSVRDFSHCPRAGITRPTRAF